MNKSETFDCCIVGAGPAGYVAAISAAQKGLKVALIEESYLGGTCLNVGCIPTKSFASSATALSTIKEAASFGIDLSCCAKVNLEKLVFQKQQLLMKMRSSLQTLITANAVTLFPGRACFTSSNSLKVSGQNATLELSFSTAVVATGSRPASLSSLPVDGESIFDSTSILELKKMPKTMIVVGGGYIGCEFASIFASFGCNVTIIEALDSLIAPQGKSLSSALTDSFIRSGITLLMNKKVVSSSKKSGCVEVTLDDGSTVSADIVLVAVGRVSVADSVAPQMAGLALTPRGTFFTNDFLQTNKEHIFAIGDCNGRSFLAHAASHQGVVAAENAAAFVQKAPISHAIDLTKVPGVIFTHPEIAFVGLTLEQASLITKAKSAKFPMAALGKAQVNYAPEGYFEFVYRESDGRILGAFVVGKEASSLIGEGVVAVCQGLSLADIKETIHPHPTLCEGFHEAALVGLGEPLHIFKEKKSL